MYFSPIEYENPLFRPPSEAYSLIFQITLGCSWNKCAFCEMYSSKKFRVRPEADVLLEIEKAAKAFPDTRKVFLADGDSLVLSTNKLLKILHHLQRNFPKLNRVSAYALPKNLNSKSQDELAALAESGLKLIYVGIESGDDELLGIINKGETHQSTAEGILIAKRAGIKSSVMILLGLGGKKYSCQHAVHSAKILNHIQPEFASTLVLSFPYRVEHYMKRFNAEYIPMTTEDLLNELKEFIQNTELESTIFRSDHASNYLILKGVLGKDKAKFLSDIEYSQTHPELLRKEWMRGL